MATFTVNHPRVKLILPPVDMRQKTRWEGYKVRVLGIWPGEEKPEKLKKGA